VPPPCSYLHRCFPRLDREHIILPNQRHPQGPINGRPGRSARAPTTFPPSVTGPGQTVSELGGLPRQKRANRVGCLNAQSRPKAVVASW
jgi:hypothetical protein